MVILLPASRVGQDVVGIGYSLKRNLGPTVCLSNGETHLELFRGGSLLLRCRVHESIGVSPVIVER